LFTSVSLVRFRNHALFRETATPPHECKSVDNTVADNPYESPATDSKPPAAAPSGPIVSLQAVLFVGASAFVCGVAGLLIGLALGTLVPGYYRSVFAGGDRPSFDPVAVGIGQGLTQGVVVGLFVGVALVAVHYWYRLRAERQRREAR
jgi:hypothetical protein